MPKVDMKSPVTAAALTAATSLVMYAAEIPTTPGDHGNRMQARQVEDAARAIAFYASIILDELQKR